MKKAISILWILLVCFSLMACGKDDLDSSSSSVAEQSSAISGIELPEDKFD